MAKAKSNLIKKFFVIVLVVFLLLLFFQLPFHIFPNLHNTPLELKNGEQILCSDTNFVVNHNKVYTIKVTDKTTNKNGEIYDVQIVARLDSNNISFKVGGRTLYFSDLQDLTEHYISNVKADSFQLSFSCDLPDVIQAIYVGRDVTDVKSYSEIVVPIFNLKVTSADGRSTTEIPLLFYVDVENIELEDSQIIFR